MILEQTEPCYSDQLEGGAGLSSSFCSHIILLQYYKVKGVQMLADLSINLLVAAVSEALSRTLFTPSRWTLPFIDNQKANRCHRNFVMVNLGWTFCICEAFHLTYDHLVGCNWTNYTAYPFHPHISFKATLDFKPNEFCNRSSHF